MPVSGKKQPRKRGRPAKPPSQRKRNNVTTRMRDQLKERLEGEARPSDRSLSEEIEFRLERSFLDDARFAALMGEDGGEMPDRERFLRILHEYYGLSGWDRTNG